METRTLRYFLAIAREENMTAAAELLHVSQSALSRQMKDLEDELGKSLLIRTNRQTLLTEDGMRLRQRAEEIISLIEKTEMEFQSPDEIIAGEVSIGAGETACFSRLAHVMANVQERWPGVTFSVYSANSLDVTERLEHGLLDFGLLFEPVNKEHYHSLSLPFSDRIGLLVSRQNPLWRREYITEEELPQIPLIVSSGLSPDCVLSRLSDVPVERLNIRGSYNLLYNASRMVMQGIGSALAIDGLIPATEQDPFAFVPLRPAKEMRLVFVWKKYQLLPKPAEVFLDEMNRIYLNTQM